MKKAKSIRGGARDGAGRPGLAAGAVAIGYTVKLTLGQRAKLDKLGGAPWVRDRIDAARDRQAKPPTTGRARERKAVPLARKAREYLRTVADSAD